MTSEISSNYRDGSAIVRTCIVHVRLKKASALYHHENLLAVSPWISQCGAQLNPAELTFGARMPTLLSRRSYVSQKSTRTVPSAKNETGEYANFERALKKVLSVSHSEIQARLATAKEQRQRGKRASGRASHAKD